MNDYKRFGLSLIALSAFLYLGVVMPIDGKTVLKTYILMGGTISLLLIATVFFLISIQCKKILLEIEEKEE
ncbi:hypothetical protein HV453_00585 [Bacillus sporothermodurans]|nr:hypothetical protein [Heyndrickxia sporothermodurans]MBL5829978.1 hypothetical protein [Heyndrickxia sporothermodurans]MBL5848543.1 hypothetical protein [Heyndrickxia sporothermodurans]